MASIKVFCTLAPQSHTNSSSSLVHQHDLPLGQVLASLGHYVGEFSSRLDNTNDINKMFLVNIGKVRDGDKVVGDGRNVGIIFTQIKLSIILECQLIVIVKLAVLLVGILD